MQITPKQSVEAREMLSLSQAAVAKGADVNRSYLSQWENENKILPDTTLIRLQAYYEEMGYQMPEESWDLDDEDLDDEPQPRRAGKSAPALPAGTYLVDGYLVPKGVTPGRAENLLAEIHENNAAIQAFLADDTEVVPVRMKTNVFQDLLVPEEELQDHSAVHEQAAAARNAVLLMARNYLNLITLRGEGEVVEGLEPVEEGEQDVDPAYLLTNAGVVARALGGAPAACQQLSGAV